MMTKLWNGDYPLVITFWLFGLLDYVLNFLTILIQRSILSSIAVGIFFVILWFGGVVYKMIWWAGVWQSANKYTGNKWFAALAKIVVVFQAACFLYYTFGGK